MSASTLLVAEQHGTCGRYPATVLPADTACLDDIKEEGDESIRIDPRLLEEIVETS